MATKKDSIAEYIKYAVILVLLAFMTYGLSSVQQAISGN